MRWAYSTLFDWIKLKVYTFRDNWYYQFDPGSCSKFQPVSRILDKFQNSPPPSKKEGKKKTKVPLFPFRFIFPAETFTLLSPLFGWKLAKLSTGARQISETRKRKKGKGERKKSFLIFSRQNVTPRAMQYSSTTNYTRDEDRGGRDLGQGQASGLALVHRLLESVKKRCMQVASIDPATRCFNLRPRYTRPLKTERVASFSTFPSIRFSPRCSSFEHFDARPISRARMYREPGYMHQGGEECKLHRWPRIILCHRVCPSASNALCADEIVFSASSSRIRQKCN